MLLRYLLQMFGLCFLIIDRFLHTNSLLVFQQVVFVLIKELPDSLLARSHVFNFNLASDQLGAVLALVTSLKQRMQSSLRWIALQLSRGRRPQHKVVAHLGTELPSEARRGDVLQLKGLVFGCKSLDSVLQLFHLALLLLVAVLIK